MKNLLISFAVAYFSNPTVGTGKVEIKNGSGYITEGMSVSPDHKTITVKPYTNGMSNIPLIPTVRYRLTLFTIIANLITGKPYQRRVSEKLESEKVIALDKVVGITFDNGWDDCTYSFKKVEPKEHE